jgi:hypothetical protein
MATAQKPTLRSALATVRKTLDALDTLPETLGEGAEGAAQKKKVEAYLEAVARLQALAEPRTRALGGRVQEAHDALRLLDDFPANPGDLTADHLEKLDQVTRAAERVGVAGKIKLVTTPLPVGPIPPSPKPASRHQKKSPAGSGSKKPTARK